MARLEQTITRADVDKHVKQAHKDKKNKKDHVRQELIRENPGIENVTIVRNGSVYNALDYLMEDIDTYGEE